MRLSPPGTHFTAESIEAMRMKCLAQVHNILMSGFELSTSAKSMYMHICMVDDAYSHSFGKKPFKPLKTFICMYIYIFIAQSS